MSKSSKLNRETYNRIAEDWNKDHSFDKWWVIGTDTFVKKLPQHGVVLDVGCGSGVKTRYLAQKGLRVVGTDLSEKMVEIAKRESPRNDFYVADMRKLDAVPGEYDGVFAQASLLHIPKSEIDIVLEELKSKLKVGGFMYIAVKGLRDGESEEAIVTESDYGYEYDRFFSYFTMKELRERLAQHGLDCVYEHVESLVHRDWLQVIAKKR